MKKFLIRFMVITIGAALISVIVLLPLYLVAVWESGWWILLYLLYLILIITAISMDNDEEDIAW